MVQKSPNGRQLLRSPGTGLFSVKDDSNPVFPIDTIDIDWDRLASRRPIVLETVDSMPAYLIKPEVLAILDMEKHPKYRLVMDLMWGTGARISEILALKPSSFIEDKYGFGVILTTLKQRPGRPSKASLSRSTKRYVPIIDHVLKDRILSYLYANSFRKNERIFTMTRQTINRRIHKLVKEAGGAPFNITCHTFRHSFAIHLLLHARPLKYVSQLLGHRSVESTEVYTNVLTIDGEHFMAGVDFH